VPAGQPVELDRQQLDLVPSGQRADRVREEGRGSGDVGAEIPEPARLQRFRAPLGEDVSALPIVAAVEQCEQPAGGDHPGRAIVAGARLGQAEPEHVHRRPQILEWKRGAVAQDRATPVGGEDQIRRDRRTVADPADDPVAVPDQVGHLRVHSEREARIAAGKVGDAVEEVPLRHQRDEARDRRQVAEIGDIDPLAADQAAKPLGLVVRAREQLVQRAQLVEELERRRMDGVAAEIAEEVGMLLEHDRTDPGASEQKPRHHPRRAAADDEKLGSLCPHRADNRAGCCIKARWQLIWQPSSVPPASATHS